MHCMFPSTKDPGHCKLKCIKNQYVCPFCSAKDAGILVMNEVGVDPGIDHLLAVQCFDEVREHGGRVRHFISFKTSEISKQLSMLSKIVRFHHF